MRYRPGVKTLGRVVKNEGYAMILMASVGRNQAAILSFCGGQVWFTAFCGKVPQDIGTYYCGNAFATQKPRHIS